MLVYWNGRFVPEEQAAISIYDRGFLYGDGLFETIRIYGNEPFLWAEHMARFERGAAALRLVPPLTAGELRMVLARLLHGNRVSDAIVRITLSRGVGRRGYSPKGAEHPTMVITVHTAPAQLRESYRVITSEHCLSGSDALARFKHCSKLVQVVAKAEADAADADEALLLNNAGNVVEATSSNIFWVSDRTVFTPPLDQGLVEGTTRDYVIALARSKGLEVKEQSITPRELAESEGVFLTSTGIEVMPVSSLNGQSVRRADLVNQLRDWYKASIKP